MNSFVPTFDVYLNQINESKVNRRRVIKDFKDKVEMVSQVIEDSLRNELVQQRSPDGRFIMDVRLLLAQSVEIFRHIIPKSRQKQYKWMFGAGIDMLGGFEEAVDQTLEDLKWIKKVLLKAFKEAIDLIEQEDDYEVLGYVEYFFRASIRKDFEDHKFRHIRDAYSEVLDYLKTTFP